MLIVVTIFLLYLIPLAMFAFNLVRPKFGIQGFLVVLAVLAGWILVLIARKDIPQSISLLNWEPVSFFPNSPTLLLDQISWIFALGLMSLTTTLSITSIAQLGQSFRMPAVNNLNKIGSAEAQAVPDTANPPGETVLTQSPGRSNRWRSWAGILVLTGCGLVAVTAGNMVTLLLGWAAVDVTELFILFSYVSQSKARERFIVAFSARMAGTALTLLAGIIPWSQGFTLSFEAINQSTSIYLIIAAGLRLGMLPIDQPAIKDLPLRRGLGTILRLAPAASSLILLVRAAYVGVLGPGTPYLLGLTVLAGLYACARWIVAKDELFGRPFWILSTSSLAIGSAIMNRPEACIAWSMASLLSGGLIFSMSIRNKNILPIAIIGMLALTALPFSPTWQGTSLYEFSPSLSGFITTPIFFLISFGFIIIHSLLLIGFTRHLMRGIYPPETQPAEHVERWVWLLYPVALIFILVTHFLIGFVIQPNLGDVSLRMWGMGAATIIISIMIGYFSSRVLRLPFESGQISRTSTGSSGYSLGWFFRISGRMFRVLTRITNLISVILEGDGGILWALVLFALIFVFLQR